jgi:hypothetical protein
MAITINKNDIIWKDLKTLRSDIKSNVLGSINGYMGSLYCEFEGNTVSKNPRTLYFIRIEDGSYESIKQLPKLLKRDNKAVEIVNSTLEEMVLTYKLSLLKK